MLSQSEIDAAAHRLYQKISNGQQAITDGEVYFRVIELYPDMDDIASCMNKDACGTRDTTIAWRGVQNRPINMEFRGMYAYGRVSRNQEKENAKPV